MKKRKQRKWEWGDSAAFNFFHKLFYCCLTFPFFSFFLLFSFSHSICILLSFQQNIGYSGINHSVRTRGEGEKRKWKIHDGMQFTLNIPVCLILAHLKILTIYSTLSFSVLSQSVVFLFFVQTLVTVPTRVQH